MAAPLVQLVGLAGDLAVIETERADMNRKLQDLRPFCEAMMREMVAAIVFSVDGVGVRDYGVVERCISAQTCPEERSCSS